MFLAYIAYIIGKGRLAVTSRLDVHMSVCLSLPTDL
jgi:hypothetical protein